MTEDERSRLLAELIEKPTERKHIWRDAQLDERDRDDIAALVDIADLLWLSARGAPPLEDDPVAAMLGLVPDRRVLRDDGNDA